MVLDNNSNVCWVKIFKKVLLLVQCTSLKIIYPNLKEVICFFSLLSLPLLLWLETINPMSKGQSFQKAKSILLSYHIHVICCTTSDKSWNQIIRLVVNWWRESGRTGTIVPWGIIWVSIISFYYNLSGYHQNSMVYMLSHSCPMHGFLEQIFIPMWCLNILKIAKMRKYKIF